MADEDATTDNKTYTTSRKNNSTDLVDDPDRDPGIDPDDSGPLLRTIGRQLKLWRDAAGYGRAEFGAMVGYSGEMIGAMERGIRNIRPEFLDLADEILKARGHLKAFKEELEKAKQPRKVRNLAKVEGQALEIGCYANTVVHGLLQTKEYAETLFRQRHPVLSENEIERRLAGRMARQELLSRDPAPLLTVVHEEVALRRPLGGREGHRRQLDHLLEVGKLRHVRLQVMPTLTEEHAGLDGSLMILKLKDGTTLAHNEVQLSSRLITTPKELQIMEMRYGMIRATALTPRESLAFIERVRDET